MAIVVEWGQNTRDCYSQGPFVVCKLGGSEWDCRVEMDCGRECPALPTDSVYEFCRQQRLNTRGKIDVISRTVGILNEVERRTPGYFENRATHAPRPKEQEMPSDQYDYARRLMLANDRLRLETHASEKNRNNFLFQAIELKWRIEFIEEQVSLFIDGEKGVGVHDMTLATLTH